MINITDALHDRKTAAEACCQCDGGFYDTPSSPEDDNDGDGAKFPKRYTGPIWMKKLVAQLIFYNLNRWQIRNEAAQATESADEYRKTRETHQSTITALYQQNSTEIDPHALYKQPLGDILNMSNERLVNWLQSHSASSSYRAHQHHDKPPHLTQNLLQQDLHKFIQHETER